MWTGSPLNAVELNYPPPQNGIHFQLVLTLQRKTLQPYLKYQEMNIQSKVITKTKKTHKTL